MYGVGVIFAIAIAASLVFSLLLYFTKLEEQSIKLLITIISFFSLFIGGFICGGKAGQRGWMVGGITGGAYTLIIFLYQYLGQGAIFTGEQSIYHICYILTAMMGGVLGVNIASGK